MTQVMAVDFSRQQLYTAAERQEQRWKLCYKNIKDCYFDAVTVGYGLRNVVDKPKAMQEIFRVLKPGEELEKLAKEAGFSQAKHYELGGGLMGNLVVTRDALSVAVTKGLNTWANNQRDLNIITSALPKPDNEMKCSTDHAGMLF
ncbi:hypothetical protein PR202_gb15083 [Eleusine coracana subsp. coracana]|uniref:Uncharacterized protein n=1 Tax=Eleusine coracana subsp. coracana TaxID=191504 RepID=A0AAV5EX19_ELECO|nr:hypothetical protein PR202_gb15083 [Eleusine coracana subsp. coracana]